MKMAKRTRSRKVPQVVDFREVDIQVGDRIGYATRNFTDDIRMSSAFVEEVLPNAVRARREDEGSRLVTLRHPNRIVVLNRNAQV